jgi:nicotinate-nucleotide--dimethylbenzimidazole phosphoribosyltransferase
MSDAATLRQQVLQLAASVPPLDAAAGAAARARQDTLTKPRGSLGRLEELSIRLAEMTGSPRPRLAGSAIFTLAGDHGVVAEGVSAYPQEVTPQMVANFLSGGAAINVIARQVGARVVIADIGVANPIPGDTTALCNLRVADGTANMAVGPAMTQEQMWRAVLAGASLVEAQAAVGLGLAGTGEMGIGNTTPATAILCAFAGIAPTAVTGPGTGLDPSGVSRKVEVIRKALTVNQPDPADAWDVLRKVGGLEIAGLAGVVLACAARRIPCVLDGFISTSAALIAARACPAAGGFLLAGHRSAEPGHDRMLALLGLEPILDLHMRLGEGTGAALAFTIIGAAARILDEMATFADAGVSDKG